MVKKKGEIKKKDSSGQKMEQILIENFVSLQKVMTNLAVKFDSLSTQMSKLLELFEISAKTLAEKDYAIKTEPDKNVSDKIDSILEQNKIIAKGVALLHENNMQQYSEPTPSPQKTSPILQKIFPTPIQSQNVRTQPLKENVSGSQSRI